MDMQMERSGMMARDVYDWIDQLRDRSNPGGRIRAAQALESLNDPRAVSALIEGLNDDDSEIRKYSAKALMQLRSVRAVDALIERLMDQNECWATRRFAAESLRKIKGARATEALARYRPDPGNANVEASERSAQKVDGGR